MKLSYNFLKQYVDINVDAYTLAEKLTHAGLEVEAVDLLATGSNLVVGEVIECYDHPNSDHLHVTKVNVKDEILQIVCGASNVRVGLKVIVAKVGCILPELTIKASKVRDVESNGMLCSLVELGYPKKHLEQQQLDGIEELDNDAPIGSDVLEYLQINDYILDLKPTPNRKDALAYFNVAQEVSAILETKLNLPIIENKYDTTNTKLNISTDNSCTTFIGQVINSVTIKESPRWLREYLHASDIKSINNVVDISNYVMLETGQPLHFYDLSKIKDNNIGVTKGINTKYTALDGIEYDLNENDILITNNNQPIGIAGIMGGDDSKIDESTKGIIIESAIFDAISIRNTAKRLGLQTEATIRFSKGIEKNATKLAIDRAIDLLIKYADAKLIEDRIIHKPINIELLKLDVSLIKINKILGTNFTMDEVSKVLNLLNFKPIVNNDTISLTIPSYREDITIVEDIAEEVIRMLGYDRLDSKLPISMATVGQLDNKQRKRRLFKEVLRGFGLNEIITYTLVSDEALKINSNGLDNPLSILAPMSEARKYIRNSLMYSILESLSYNTNRKATNLNLFELSNVYGNELVEERLGIIMSGSLINSKLKKVNLNSDFYTLKGIIISMLEKIGISGSRIKIDTNILDTNNYHPYQSATLLIDNKVVGIFGKVHPNICSKFKIEDTYYAELSFDIITNTKTSKMKFSTIDKYPSVKRDISLVCKDDITAASLIRTISSSSNLVKNIEIFDIYKGEHVEEGYKSIAISFEYQANDHTLTEQEILNAHTKVLEELNIKCNAILRS